MPAQLELEPGLFDRHMREFAMARELLDEIHHRPRLGVVMPWRRSCRAHRVDLPRRHGRPQKELLIGQMYTQPLPQFRRRGHRRLGPQFPCAGKRFDAIHDVGGDRNVGLAEPSDSIADRLVRYHFIALSRCDVHDGLRQDDLRERRHHDGPSKFLAHPPEFFDHRAFFVGESTFRELSAHCPDHAARQLVP